MWLLYVSIKKYVQTYSLVWSFLTPVRRFECLNLNPRGRSAILAAFSPLQRSHMRRRLTAVLGRPRGAITVSHHKNKAAVRPQFLNFLDRFSLSTRTDEEVSLTSALVKEKIDMFFFTHQQIKFPKSELVNENLLVCNRLKIVETNDLTNSSKWLKLRVANTAGVCRTLTNACSIFNSQLQPLKVQRTRSF